MLVSETHLINITDCMTSGHMCHMYSIFFALGLVYTTPSITPHTEAKVRDHFYFSFLGSKLVSILFSLTLKYKTTRYGQS